jgi:hypothetical protein
MTSTTAGSPGLTGLTSANRLGGKPLQLDRIAAVILVH